MSSTVTNILFSEKSIEDVAGLISRLARLLQIELVNLAGLLDESLDDWDERTQSVRDDLFDDDYPEPQIVKQGIPISQCLDIYEPGKVLLLDCMGTPVSNRIVNELMRVPEEIRGTACPSDPMIEIGWSHLYQADDPSDKPVYYGKSFSRIKFFGYGQPRDWERASCEFMNLPAILELRREYEHLTGGPIKQFVRYSY